jgi:hypothetical protein
MKREPDMNPIPKGRAAGDALRLSRGRATFRRRAAVVALTALPFVMASGLTALLLSYGSDPREMPARAKLSPDAPAGQTDRAHGAGAEQSRAGAPKLARKRERPKSADADRTVAARATGGRRKSEERLRRSRRDRPARRLPARPRFDRRSSALVRPVPRPPSHRGRGGGGGRLVSYPDLPPTSTLARPPTAAPTPPPATQPAPQLTEPNRDHHGDSASGRPPPAHVGEGTGGAPAHRGSEREPHGRGGAPHQPEHAQQRHPEHPHDASGREPPTPGPIGP